MSLPTDSDPRGDAALLGLLAPLADGLVVVDIGARAFDAAAEAYGRLLAAPAALLVGFEPDAAECARLAAEQGQAARRFLPFAVGSGQRATFHACRSPHASSLLRPDAAAVARFENLAPLCEVIGTHPIDTVRLDDVADLGEVDFLKLDVQGATLQVLGGAARVLGQALAVHAEVDFAPIYEGEGLFSEIEQHLRARGFMFHHFARLEGRRVLSDGYAVGPAARQLVWADAVFLPAFGRIEALDARGLARLAWIAHAAYESFDLAMLALRRLDARDAGERAARYVEILRLTGQLA